MNKRIKIKALLEHPAVGSVVTVMGWVKSFRSNRFIALNDGSTIHTLQCVLDTENTEKSILDGISTGAALSVTGKLVTSQGKGQSVELQIKEVRVLGIADPEDVQKTILQPKKHSLEFLREQAHLRFRTNTFGAINRIRNTMIFAIHEFFQARGFVNIHTPIITASDAEGAGEMFRVTTLNSMNPPKDESGKIDFSKDFFGKETNLTVSGQLEGEMAALALGDIYTFGPTFRAENSNTTRHLAEFWMIEPEMAFAELEDNMNIAEAFLKEVISKVLDRCPDDLAFLDNRIKEEEKNMKQEERSEMGLIDRLKFVIDNDFQRITYTEAIDILRNSNPNKKKKFEYLIEEWGADLQSEHERFLVEKHFKKPVIITDYPAKIKAFYMKLSADGKTVRAMDILFPGIGEIVGGSQREENYDILVKKMKEVGIPTKDLWWYLDSRKLGSVPHSGFGLGFERFVLFMTGMGNIRDVIPFPRTPKNAEF